MSRRGWQSWRLGSLAAVLGSVLGALPSAPVSAQSIYTCTDAQGRRITSDRPIPECLDREQRELGPSGSERRRIPPVLSENERAALEQQQRKEAEERNRVLEERRKERALVLRYPNKAAHDQERAQVIAQADGVIALIEKRLLELHAQRKALDLEMEFYQKNPASAPAALRRKLAENQDAQEDQERALAAQNAEKYRIHARFDAEYELLQRLWAAGNHRAPVPAGAANSH